MRLFPQRASLPFAIVVKYFSEEKKERKKKKGVGGGGGDMKTDPVRMMGH